MRTFLCNRSSFIMLGLLIAQSAYPALAAESDWQNSSSPLGQSDWICSASPSNSGASTGQSDWTGSGQPATSYSSGTIHQSGWQTPHSTARGTATGQSGWTQPGGSAGSTGQSGWTQPGGSAGSTGQSGWTQPGSSAGSTGQSGWTQPGAGNVTGQSGWMQAGQAPASMARSNGAMGVSPVMAQSANLPLQGSVSMDKGFGNGDMTSLGDGNLTGSADNGGKALQNFKDISEYGAGPGVSGAGMGGMMAGMGGGGMEEMMGNVMMMPMMMAASAGLLNGGFRTYGPGGGLGGFRTYGPGGGIGGQREISLSNPVGYYARRAAIRALRRVGR